MSGYVLLKLDDLISRYEEDKIVDILSSFSCSMNLDVAEFLHEKAINRAYRLDFKLCIK